MFTLVVIMSIIGMGLCHEEFHCTFMNDDLKLEKNGVKQYVWWGPQKTDITPIIFQNNTDMLAFFQSLNNARREFYRKNIFDDVSAFLTDYDAFNKMVLPTANLGENIDYFTETYVPSMEKSQDHLGLLVKFFRGLQTELPIVNDHFYLAVKGIEVRSQDIVKIMEQEAGQDFPLDRFEFESLVGIIKIKDYTGSLGYAIINLDYPEDSVPFVLESDDLHPLPDQYTDPQGYLDYVTTYLNNGYPLTYTLTGQDKSYIRNERMGQIFNTTTWATLSTNMIYLRPVCSVTEIQNRVNLRTTVVRSIMKYAPNFHLKAFAFARIAHSYDSYQEAELAANATETLPTYTIGVTFAPTYADYDLLMKQMKNAPQNLTQKADLAPNNLTQKALTEKKKEEEPIIHKATGRSFHTTDLDHLKEEEKLILEEAATFLKESLKEELSDLGVVTREINKPQAVITEAVDHQSPGEKKYPEYPEAASTETKEN